MDFSALLEIASARAELLARNDILLFPKLFQQPIRRRADQAFQRAGVERLVEVGNQILDVFQADAGADDAVAGPFADAGFLLGGQVGGGVHVQVGGIVEQQAVGVAERGGVGENADFFRQGDGRAQSAFELEGQHPTEAGHLAGGQFVVRVALQAGIKDAADFGMRLQETGHFQGILTVLFACAGAASPARAESARR